MYLFKNGSFLIIFLINKTLNNAVKKYTPVTSKLNVFEMELSNVKKNSK
jgi:hypothetical protein